MLRPVERRQLILKDISQASRRSQGAGGSLIPELSEKYEVSEMTIRRDLKALEEKGLIMRTWGGAILWPPGRDEPFVLNRDRRRQLHRPCKEAIAREAAARWVQNGDIIIMEGGTTATAMAPFLAPYKELTVVTNGLATADRLQRSLPPDATIICSGGILRPESSTFVGPVAEQFFRKFHARRLFLSATGFTLETGLTDPRMLETQVKRAMIAAVDEVVVLLDSTKFGVKSLMTVLEAAPDPQRWNLECPPFAALITDDGAPSEVLEQLGDRGVQVTTVQP